MTADRKTIINGVKIEEFYWAGKMICYVDNRLSSKTFDEEVTERGNDESKIQKKQQSCLLARF
jgi:hypothetical protein